MSDVIHTPVINARPTSPAQQGSVRAINRSLVLDLLRRGGAMTRPQLAQQTGLTLPTIGSIIDELITERLVVDRGAGIGSVRGGRRPRVVEFNSGARRVLGVNIGVHRTTVAAGDARGTMFARLDTATPSPADPERVVAMVASTARHLLRDIGEVDAVGVCVPGLVELDTGVCLAARNLGWDFVPIGNLLEEALGAPALVLNSTQAAAVAEQVHGVSQGIQDLLWIYVGTGIGAGLISGGRLLRGSRGLTGEFGHTCVDEAGPQCGCGRRGCLEAVASGGAMIRAAVAAGVQFGDHPGFGSAELVAAGGRGERAAVELLTNAGSRVGAAAAGVVHLLNPAQVVLGGTIGSVDGPFTKAFRDSLATNAIPFSLASTSIVCSTLGGDAAIQGALLVARQQSDLNLRLVIGGGG